MALPVGVDRYRAGPIADDDAMDLAAAAHARSITIASGSSFYWAMRMMSSERRKAMYGIYAFCREVDDIADGPEPDAEKRRRLDAWRAEIAEIYDGKRPSVLTARALSGPIAAFGLRQADFQAVIDGMEMDVGDGFRGPSLDELELYCTRVAGAVGLLSIKAFGAQEQRAEDFALALGTALQFTNILRDLSEDAVTGRLYLPRELLAKAGIEMMSPDAVLAHRRLPMVCAAFARMARDRFSQAESSLVNCAQRPLRPAVVMMMHYRRLLSGLEQRGWQDLDKTVVISKTAKMWLAFRYGILG